MTNITLNVLSQQDDTGTDVLTALLRNGARQLIAQALDVELQQLLQA
ncbi:IS256 family transposase, partial [Acinetobacter baumannii]